MYPKIQNLIWRAISGALPVATRLQTRGIQLDSICQRCCVAEESINHIFFECPYARAVWMASDIRELFAPSNVLEINLQTCLDLAGNGNLQDDIRLRPMWIIWTLWKARNEFLFSKKNVQPQEVFSKCLTWLQEWIHAQVYAGHQNQVQVTRNRLTHWEPPPQGWYKLNFDSSFHIQSHCAGIGWILRDNEGKFITAGTSQVHNIHSAFQAEAAAFLLSLQFVWSNGWRNVWFENDCQGLIDIINQGLDSLELGNILPEIRHWMNHLPLCSIDFSYREKNQAADALAKKSYEFPVFTRFNIPPEWLVKYLYYPYTV